MKRPCHSENAGRFWPTRKFYRYWYVVGLLLVLAGIAIPLDTLVAKIALADRLRGDVARMLALSECFATGFGVAVIVMGVWLLAPLKRRFVPRLLVSAILPGAIVHGMKILVARKRPRVLFREYPESGWDTWLGWMPGKGNELAFNLEYASQSFPSAHTATAISFALVLGWVFPRGRFLFLFLALLAAAQRVVFEAHWLSDVFVGAAIGVMVGSAMTKNWGIGYWCGLFERPADLRVVRLNEQPEAVRSRSA